MDVHQIIPGEEVTECCSMFQCTCPLHSQSHYCLYWFAIYLLVFIETVNQIFKKNSFQALPYVFLLIVLLFFIYAVVGMQVSKVHILSLD